MKSYRRKLSKFIALSELYQDKNSREMKSTISIIFSIIIILGFGVYIMSENRKFDISLSDNKTMLNPVPEELIITQNVNDSDVVFINIRCVVHVKYSESELKEMEKKFKNKDEWDVFYDEYLFYNEDVTMFLYKRAIVKTVSQKKYILFVMTSGKKITVDRMKSAGKLFFFNPDTGVSQCNASDFDQRKYRNF